MMKRRIITGDSYHCYQSVYNYITYVIVIVGIVAFIFIVVVSVHQ